MKSLKKRSRSRPVPATARLLIAVGSALALVAASSAAEKSADEIAQELSNPTNALGSMASNFDITQFEGNLPGAGDQVGFSYLFQPSLPFPQGNGYNLLIRPAIPLFIQQPVFNSTTGRFEDEGIDLGDISFDVAYGTTYKSGVLFLVGAVGTLPTSTDSDLGADQWQLGPEVAVGVVKKWGVAGALITHKWDIAGESSFDTNVTGGQYFYAFALKNGWQIASGPTWSYNHEADSDNALTLPLGIGLSKTHISKKGTPLKFQVQYWHFIESPDEFGPDWQLRFNFTPVIKLPWGKG